MNHRTIPLEIPGYESRFFTHLILDFTGTLSLDGVLLPGVAERIRSAAEHLDVTVLTADTFGTAEAQLAGLPVVMRRIECGAEKADLVEQAGAPGVIAIGNGRNDVAMLERAGLAIAVIGPEGAAGELLRAADVVVRDIHDALDLILYPLRLKATLRD